MSTIFVYDGPGVAGRGVLMACSELQRVAPKSEVKTISPENLLISAWEDNCAAIVFPGGRDVPYCETLAGAANDKIKRFVQAGGRYLGLCAGAYYGCAAIEFDMGGELEVRGFRELAFFPGLARGPALGVGSYKYEDDQSAIVIQLRREKSNICLSSYFSGGCYFVAASNTPGVEVLFTYDGLSAFGETSPMAAIISCQVGEGKAILSGVHPEYSAVELKRLRYRYPALVEKLAEMESERAALMAIVVDELLG